MKRPLVIDLFCGLGGWSKGFLAEGWDAVGFDIERHRYPARAIERSHVKCSGADWNRGDSFNGNTEKRLRESPLTGGWSEYPAQLVLQDVLTLDGRQFRGQADLIVASPPCTEYSYMAMPWKRAKQIRAALLADVPGMLPFPKGYTGSRTLAQLNALFNACFRIAAEAELPLVVENVKGAQPWVGQAKANFGSYYLWGDIANVGGRIVRPDAIRFGIETVKAAGRMPKQPGRNFHFPEKYGIPSPSFHGAEHEDSVRNAMALKTVGHVNIRDGHSHTRHLTNQRESDAVRSDGRKHGGDCFNDPSWPGKAGGLKQCGSGPEWFDNGICKSSSRSDSRKAASAQIAEIPFDLASWVARCFKP